MNPAVGTVPSPQTRGESATSSAWTGAGAAFQSLRKSVATLLRRIFEAFESSRTYLRGQPKHSEEPGHISAASRSIRKSPDISPRSAEAFGRARTYLRGQPKHSEEPEHISAVSRSIRKFPDISPQSAEAFGSSRTYLRGQPKHLEVRRNASPGFFKAF